MTNFLRGCRLLWRAVTTEWLIAATTALAGESIWNHNGVGEAIMETAKAQLNRAENNYKLAERTVEDLKQRVKMVWDMLQEAERELEDYRFATLDIHDKIAKKGGNSK